MKPKFFGILVTTLILIGCSSALSPNYLRQAEEYSRKGDVDNAINAYEHHMESRLAVKNRSDWENPYFYLLLIGDLELSRNDPKAALRNYLSAAEHDIHPSLISDRIRAVASWYETHGELQSAIDLLRKYRYLDTLLFDAMLDRIGKKLTAEENANSWVIGDPL